MPLTIYDFGDLIVEEEALSTKDGKTVTKMTLKGFFDGSQKGEAGWVGDYFEGLPCRTERIVVDFSHCRSFADVALALVKKVKKELNKKGGDLVIFSPPDFLAEILSISGVFSYFNTQREAIQFFDETNNSSTRN